MKEEKEIPEAEDASAKIAAELSSIRSMRIAGLIVFGAGMTTIIGIMVATQSLNIKLSPIVILPIAIGTSVISGLCMNKKCPKCGKQFYGMPIRFFWAHSCMYCKISYKNDAKGDS